MCHTVHIEPGPRSLDGVAGSMCTHPPRYHVRGQVPQMATEWWFFLLIEGFGAFFVEREIFPPWAPAAPACESATCCTPEKNSFIIHALPHVGQPCCVDPVTANSNGCLRGAAQASWCLAAQGVCEQVLSGSVCRMLFVPCACHRRAYLCADTCAVLARWPGTCL